MRNSDKAENAMAVATENGHDMRDLEGYQSATFSLCRKCGAYLRIDQEGVHGDALQQYCMNLGV